jgi:hypothetical protein
MGSVIYDSAASIQQLLDRGFVMPIHFAAVGINGVAVTGTCRFLSGNSGFECQITAHTPGPEGMMAPVNIMYVDSKGEAALVVLRQSSDEPMENSPAA